MKRPALFLTVMLAALALEPGCAKKAMAPAVPPNPLVAEFRTPFGVPPFDLIKSEHFMPAFEQGMAEQKKEVEAIARTPSRRPSPTRSRRSSGAGRSSRGSTPSSAT